MSNPTSVASTDTPRWLVPVVLSLLVSAGYIAACWHNQFIYDDQLMILQAKPLTGLRSVVNVFIEHDGTPQPYFRPLTRLTLLAQKTFHGDNPRPFHIFNAALAGFTLLATYALLRRPGLSVRHWPAVFAATLFATHPAMSSCVYPAASGRETLLQGLFAVLAVWAYLRPGKGWSLASLFFFACALAGKEQAIVLPAIFFLADQLKLTDAPRAWPSRLVRYAAMVVVVAVYLWMRQRLYAGAEFSLAIKDEPLGPLWSLLYSLQVLIVPHIELVYEPLLDVWWSWQRLGVALLIMALLIIVGCRHGKTLKHLTLFWLAWFVLMQLTTANILVQPTFFAQRYVWLSLLTLPALVGAIVSQHWTQPAWRRSSVIVGAALVAVTMAVSVHRARYFLDEFVFHTQWIRTNPQCATAHMHLGAWHLRENQLLLAIEHYGHAIRLDPDRRQYVNHAAAYAGQGQALEKLGHLDEAAAMYHSALRENIHQASAHTGLASVYAQRNQFDQALHHFQIARELQPQIGGAYQNVGNTLMFLNRPTEAMAMFAQAIELDPSLTASRVNLATLFVQAGQIGKAEQQLRLALEYNDQLPAVHFQMADILETQGRFDEAATHYKRAIQLNPDHASAYYFLGMVLMRLERANEAINAFSEAVRLRPEAADAHLQLASAHAGAGRFGPASQSYERAYALQPQRASVLLQYAWFLATTDDPHFRNGQLAVTLGQQACQLTQNQPQALDVLAAAYAETGRFTQAVLTLHDAIERARQSAEHDLIPPMQQRLTQYQAGQPHRQRNR